MVSLYVLSDLSSLWMTDHALTSGVIPKWDFNNWLRWGRDLGSLGYSKIRKWIFPEKVDYGTCEGTQIQIMTLKISDTPLMIKMSKMWQGKMDLNVHLIWVKQLWKKIRFENLYTRNSELTLSCLSYSRPQLFMNIFRTNTWRHLFCNPWMAFKNLLLSQFMRLAIVWNSF